MLSVAKNDISDITDSESVHEHCSCMDFIDNFCRIVIQLKHISGLNNKYVFLRYSQ